MVYGNHQRLVVDIGKQTIPLYRASRASLESREALLGPLVGARLGPLGRVPDHEESPDGCPGGLSWSLSAMLLLYA